MNVKLKWKFGIKGARGVTQRPPVVVDDLVVASFNHGQGSSFYGVLVGLRATDGSEKWRLEFDHYINEAQVSDDENLFLTSFDGKVYCISLEGKIIWEAQPSQRNLWSGIIVRDKFVYAEIGGGSSFTRGICTKSGEVVWEYENGGHSFSLCSDSNGSIFHSSVGRRSHDSDIALHCIDSDSGQAQWQTPYSQYLFRPLIFEGNVLIGSKGHVAAFEMKTGNLVATQSIGDEVNISGKPVATAAGVVFVTEKGLLTSIKPTKTKKLLRKPELSINTNWSTQLNAQCKAPLIGVESQVVVITEDGQLNQVDTSDGSITSSLKVPGFKEGFGVTAVDGGFIISASRECYRI